MDAELEGSVLGQSWAGIYSPREFSWHLQAELGLLLQPSAELGLPWGHSVMGCVSAPDPKRRIPAARGMNPVLNVIPTLSQGAKHL